MEKVFVEGLPLASLKVMFCKAVSNSPHPCHIVVIEDLVDSIPLKETLHP